MSKIQEFELTMSKDILTDFLLKVQEVSKINPAIKVVFEDMKITFYTFAPKSTTICKACFMDTYYKGKDVFLPKNPKELSENLEMIIGDSKKFVKKLAFYRDSEKVTIVIGYRKNNSNINHIMWLKIKDKKLKMTIPMQELHLVKNVPRAMIVKKAEQEPIFFFDIDVEILNDVKKLNQLNPENDVIGLRIKDNIVFLEEEGRWEMETSETMFEGEREEISAMHLTFGKKHFNNLENSNMTRVKVFDEFLMVCKTKEDTQELDSLLMIGVEKTEL